MNLPWWQTAVFYQIYPRSFFDSSGDGIGDLAGILSKLDYLEHLGIDAIWLSPHYPSPQHDCGYDISNYTNVAPEYGTLDDFKDLLIGAHRRSIRIVLDLVLNHTSDQHPWFVESRQSKDSPKRDWYIWRDGVNGNPPNNWNSTFGGPAWELDPKTGQYYYHYFFKQQPDLNWRNPSVKNAMYSAIRFWLDMGVDGFRLDAIGTIFENPSLKNHSARISFSQLFKHSEFAKSRVEKRLIHQLWRKMFKHQVEQPGVHELMQELRQLVDEYHDRVLVGETDDIAYHGDGKNELHLVYNFPLKNTEKLTPHKIRQNQKTRLRTLMSIEKGGWPCNTLGNHDSPRVYNHFGDGQHDNQLARLSLALMLTLQGTPFLYYGEEIGMTDYALEDISQFRDLLGVWYYEAQILELGLSPESALKGAINTSRDKCRTPMQWSNTMNAGFSSSGAKTWLPVNPNYARGINTDEQEKDPDSLLNFYRRLLRIRRQSPALNGGDYTPIMTSSKNLLTFLRSTPQQKVLVCLNYSSKRSFVRYSISNSAKILFSSDIRVLGFDQKEANIKMPIRINPFEAVILDL
jgi:alpha-glucosidase